MWTSGHHGRRQLGYRHSQDCPQPRRLHQLVHPPRRPHRRVPASGAQPCLSDRATLRREPYQLLERHQRCSQTFGHAHFRHTFTLHQEPPQEVEDQPARQDGGHSHQGHCARRKRHRLALLPEDVQRAGRPNSQHRRTFSCRGSGSRPPLLSDRRLPQHRERQCGGRFVGLQDRESQCEHRHRRHRIQFGAEERLCHLRRHLSRSQTRRQLPGGPRGQCLAGDEAFPPNH